MEKIKRKVKLKQIEMNTFSLSLTLTRLSHPFLIFTQGTLNSLGIYALLLPLGLNNRDCSIHIEIVVFT